MMTMKDYEQMFADDMENAREFVRTFKQDVTTLKELHHNARLSHNNPQKTIDEYVDAVGYEKAVAIIANMVNARAEWDGRISPRNAEWARERANCGRDVVIHLGGYADDVIHSCHLDQLANYMRRKAV